jgi:hypothetical protein
VSPHTRLLGHVTGTEVRCDPCTLIDHYPSTASAQDAAEEHNRLRHAYPEQQLEIPEENHP